MSVAGAPEMSCVAKDPMDPFVVFVVRIIIPEPWLREGQGGQEEEEDVRSVLSNPSLAIRW